jgi:molybdopterin synthase sulfur carrier subunit
MSAERTITVRYFASLREAKGLSSERVRTRAATASELVADLAKQAKFGLPEHLIRLSINGDFAAPDAEIQEGDEICLIPPVSGG